MYIKIHIGTHVFGHVLLKQSNHDEKTLKLSKPNVKPKTKWNQEYIYKYIYIYKEN